MSFLFRNNSVINAIYLLIRSTRLGFYCETQIILIENGINKQNTHTYLFLKKKKKKNPTYFTNPYIFMGKIKI